MQSTDTILPGILLTGHTQFTHDGVIGTRHRHSFVQQNSPEIVKRNFEQRLSVNAKCGIPANKTSQFIERGLIASYYRNILKSALLLYLENVTIATEEMWIDEGLRPHLGRQLTENLTENCQDEQKVVDRWHGHLGHRIERPTTFIPLGFHEV